MAEVDENTPSYRRWQEASKRYPENENEVLEAVRRAEVEAFMAGGETAAADMCEWLDEQVPELADDDFDAGFITAAGDIAENARDRFLGKGESGDSRREGEGKTTELAASLPSPEPTLPAATETSDREAVSAGPECPGPDCMMCSGEACNKCGAGCWASPGTVHCEHDVSERHEAPDLPGAVWVQAEIDPGETAEPTREQLEAALRNVCKTVGLMYEAAFYLADGPPVLTPEEIAEAQKFFGADDESCTRASDPGEPKPTYDSMDPGRQPSYVLGSAMAGRDISPDGSVTIKGDPGETAEQARERRDIRVMAALRSGVFTEGARICFGRADAGWAVWGDGYEMLDPDRAPFFDDPADAIEWAASLCGAPALTEGRHKPAPTPGASEDDEGAARLRELEASADMACVNPDPECECSGCTYARESNGEGTPT